jgi:diguanylate cyclase (GGDEF)-like protein
VSDSVWRKPLNPPFGGGRGVRTPIPKVVTVAPTRTRAGRHGERQLGVALRDRRRVVRAIRQTAAGLPQGQLLPESSWRRRHRWIVVLLWLHVVGLYGFGVIRGFGFLAPALEVSIVAAAAALASSEQLGRRARMILASTGLVTCSALLVYFWNGQIEAHFHFFVVIPILILYQDWLPFLLALTYVIVHHGLLGAVAPHKVYDHGHAVAHPWRWALIHGAFVLASSAASIVSWRANEQMLREPLTGLPGRTVFLHRVTRALERLRRRKATVAVLFVDLDGFKLLNDSLGHGVGDELLVSASRRLELAVRRTDIVARIGGDEFAILCEDIVSEREALELAERVRQAVGSSFWIGGNELATGASVGIAFTSSPDMRPEELIANADAAMYRAKRGEGCVVFSEAIRVANADRVALESALRGALDRGEFALEYQPIFSLSSGGFVGAEALLRWRDSERGLVPPNDFIPLAEQTGLIIPVGRWVLEQACREAVVWPADGRNGGAAPYVAVNLSARQFAQPDLAEMVASILHEAGLDPTRLVLEITESVTIDEADQPLETLLALKRLGVRVFLDDFGNGYSSLSYLRRFPIDALKVDQSFVATLGQAGDEGAILTAVQRMADALGLDVIAEGVETADQARHVHLLGYDLAQGYHFARPQPPEALRALFGIPRELAARPAA